MSGQRRGRRRPLIVVTSPYAARRLRVELAGAVDVLALAEDAYRFQVAGGVWGASRVSGADGDPVLARLDLAAESGGLRAAATRSSGVWLATDPDRRGEWLARAIGDALADATGIRRMRPEMLQPDLLQQAMDVAGDPAEELAESYRAEAIIRHVTGLKLSEDLSARTRLERFVGLDQLMALELLAQREWDLIKGQVPAHGTRDQSDGPLTTARLIGRSLNDLGMAPRATMIAARWLYDLGAISFPWTDPVTNPEIHVAERPPEALPYPPQMGLVWPSETDHLDLYAMLTGAQPSPWRVRRAVPEAVDPGPRYTSASLTSALHGRGLVRSENLASAIHSSLARGNATRGSRARGAAPHDTALSPSLMGLALARYVHDRCGARLDSAAYSRTLVAVDAIARGVGTAESVISDHFHGCSEDGSPGFLELIADIVPAEPEDWSVFIFHGDRLSSRRPRGMITGPCVVAGRYGPIARQGQQRANLDEAIAPADLTRSAVVGALGLPGQLGAQERQVGESAARPDSAVPRAESVERIDDTP